MTKVSRAVIWICFLTVLVGSEVSAQGPHEKIADETETVKTLEESFQAVLLGDEDFVCAETLGNCKTAFFRRCLPDR